jgi:thiamine biosynthesis lipoprotein
MYFLRARFFAMASENEVQLYAEDEVSARKAAEHAIAEVTRIEAKYSRYRPDSVISQINAAAGVMRPPIAIDDETAQLLDYAKICFQQSGGLFDITSGVLRRAWDFKSGKPPAPSAVAALLPFVGFDRIERPEPNAIRLPLNGMELDFGGFGKEYAVDRALFVLTQAGIEHTCVNLAGDLAVTGSHADGSPWGVGIRHPRRDNQLLATLPVHSGAIATSGDYERYFVHEGKRYCHILNPRTGFPVDGLQSVTVAAPTCLVAGSATTVAMLKGDRDGIDWLNSLGVPYLAVTAAGQSLNTFAPARAETA